MFEFVDEARSAFRVIKRPRQGLGSPMAPRTRYGRESSAGPPGNALSCARSGRCSDL